MKTLQIACIVGARPNFIKMASILEGLRHRPKFTAQLIHTGQHFSPEMSGSLFEELELPEPDINLQIGGGTQTEQTAAIMLGLEKAFVEKRPDVVLVVGDVNSTLGATLVAAKLRIAVAHVEAGLRSFDRRMPEEINRLVTDAISDYLFASEPSGVKNLLAEGISRSKVFFVGNVMIDTLLRFRQKASQSEVLRKLGLECGSYAVATLHRPSNVDDPVRLKGLLTMLAELSRELPVVFPVHPRTRRNIKDFGDLSGGLTLTPPLGYLDFLRLMSDARLVLTDSGGIQEETTILSVPCLTLRENTERPVTVEQGTNRLAGVEPESILRTAKEVLGIKGHGDTTPVGTPRKAQIPELWDGKASSRILDILEGHG